MKSPKRHKSSCKFLILFYSKKKNWKQSSTVCNDRDWINNITEEGQLPVGFDMEWPFTYTTGPLKTALIQFSFSTNVCYLFQVWKHKTLPESLVNLVHHKKLLLHGNCIKKYVHSCCFQNLINILNKCQINLQWLEETRTGLSRCGKC